MLRNLISFMVSMADNIMLGQLEGKPKCPRHLLAITRFFFFRFWYLACPAGLPMDMGCDADKSHSTEIISKESRNGEQRFQNFDCCILKQDVKDALLCFFGSNELIERGIIHAY